MAMDRKSIIQVKFRLRRDVLRKLERAVKAGDRSVNDEIGRRLARSFDYEGILGSERTQILARLVAQAVSLIERGTGKRWNEEPEILESVLDAVRLIGRAAGLVGTKPDERPDDARLDALKNAVGESADSIVKLVAGDEELQALTDRDIMKNIMKDPGDKS